MRRAIAPVAAALLALVLLGCTGGEGGADSAATTVPAVTTITGPATTTTTTPTGEGSSASTTAAPGAEDLTGAELTALLTPEDVQAVSGFADVGRAGRNPERGLGGDLNFVLPGGRPLLMVVVVSADSFAEWKADPDSYREDLAGVGEAAFIGPAPAMNEVPYLLVFRSGERTIGLLTYDDADAEGWTNLLTLEQLQELARVIIGRL